MTSARLAALRGSPLDVALAAVVVAGALVEIWSSDLSFPKFGASAGAAAVAVGVAGRRRFPLACLGIVLGANLVYLAASGDPLPGLGDPPNSVALAAGWLIAVYSAAAWSEPRRDLIALAAAVLVALAFNSASGDAAVNDYLAATLGSVGVPWLLGALRARHRRARELRARAARLEREREERARVAVAEERSRIARELHDIVAHKVTLMVVQAQAGEEVAGTDSERARAALRSVQEVGRQAMAELRRLLDVLGEDGRDGELAPQPGLGQLAQLVADVEAAGVRVELKLAGRERRLPAGVGLSAYRIAQEALTNAIRHGRASAVQIELRYGGDSLEMRISDNGQHTGNGTAGRGLIGMRERARLCGGRLEAGPAMGGGYQVRAVLPVGGGR